jgi:flagellar hook-length control protein FliK
VIPMNVIPQVTKSSPNPGGIGPPDSGPQNEALGAEFSAALKGEMKGADLSAGSGGSGSAQSDTQDLFKDASKTGVPNQTVPGAGESISRSGVASTAVMPEGDRLVPDASGQTVLSRTPAKTASPAKQVDPVALKGEKQEVLSHQQGTLQQKHAKGAVRDESREAAAGALAQGIHMPLLPQVTVQPKDASREQDQKGSGFRGRPAAGVQGGQLPGQAGDSGISAALSAEGAFGNLGLAGKDADAISSLPGGFTGGELPHAESVSVDPRVRDLLSQSDLKVQGFELKQGSELKQGAAPAAATALTALSKPAESMGPNRVSTEDFLSLRGVKKEKSSKGPTEAKVENPMMQTQPFGRLHLGPVLDAPVTQGTAGKPVLSHDALHQITRQVSGLSQARQDGEIKIRLKPDHLGELMMSVKTSGDKVAVQIKAQDHEAKKIIEDSIGRLKDSLSSQNLTLHKVDVVTQPSAGQASDGGFQMDFGTQSQGNFSRNDSQQYRDSSSNGRQEFLYDERPVSSNLKSINPAWARRPGGSGGLDLIA